MFDIFDKLVSAPSMPYWAFTLVTYIRCLALFSLLHALGASNRKPTLTMLLLHMAANLTANLIHHIIKPPRERRTSLRSIFSFDARFTWYAPVYVSQYPAVQPYSPGTRHPQPHDSIWRPRDWENLTYAQENYRALLTYNYLPYNDKTNTLTALDDPHARPLCQHQPPPPVSYAMISWPLPIKQYICHFPICWAAFCPFPERRLLLLKTMTYSIMPRRVLILKRLPKRASIVMPVINKCGVTSPFAMPSLPSPNASKQTAMLLRLQYTLAFILNCSLRTFTQEVMVLLSLMSSIGYTNPTCNLQMPCPCALRGVLRSSVVLTRIPFM